MILPDGRFAAAAEVCTSAPGTLPPGTRACKILSDDGDDHADGARCTVSGSLSDGAGPLYCVRWDDRPDLPVWIAGHRLVSLEEYLDSKVRMFREAWKVTEQNYKSVLDTLQSISNVDRKLAREQHEERFLKRVDEEVAKRISHALAPVKRELSETRTQLEDALRRVSELSASKRKLREALERAKERK